MFKGCKWDQKFHYFYRNSLFIEIYYFLLPLKVMSAVVSISFGVAQCLYDDEYGMGPVKQNCLAQYCDYFLIHWFNHVFWVLKRTVSLRRLF